MSSILQPGKKQAEQLKLAEAESEIARRKGLGKTRAGGRGSLIATAQTGVTGNLGGS